MNLLKEIIKNPEKYEKPFKTIIPKKNWSLKSLSELEGYANSDEKTHFTDWVEKALEWAQRIQNGETWENVCNDVDTAGWFRLVLWKDNCYHCVGGSQNCGLYNSASFVDPNPCDYINDIEYAVPSITKRV